MALYYDPIIDHLHRSRRGGHEAGLALTFYLGPHRREVAERIYAWAVEGLGWSDPSRPVADVPGDPRFVCQGIALAREFGDRGTLQRLLGHAEEHYEPTWGPGPGEFAYRFGLDEPHPRGQPNALLMLAEVAGEASWWRIFNRPNTAKLAQPTVSGVDYPRLGIARAFYDAPRRGLAVSTYAAEPTAVSAPTTFDVEGLADPAGARVWRDGREHTAWRVSGAGRISIDSTVADHDIWVEEAAR